MSPTTVFWILFALACIGLTAIVECVLGLFDAWSERREQTMSPEVENHMDAIKSMERIQTAYFQAHAALRDQQGGQHGQ